MLDRKIDIDEVIRQVTPIEEALQKAFESVVRENAWLGLPIITWKDGKVVEIDPNTLLRDGTVPSRASATIPTIMSTNTVAVHDAPAQ